MLSKNIIKYIRQLEMKKYRSREGVFVAEGPKVVVDLLRRYEAKAVYATDEWTADTRGISVERITHDELGRISFLQHPQQVLALFNIPKPTEHSVSGALSIALDGVQDPGNLGTIIRIADWFGIDTIFCSENTADVYNPKVVQATMGSIARVNIIYISLEKLLSSLPDGFPVYGTLLDGEDIYRQELTDHGIIVMGNEGNGISPAIRKLINHRLLIPSFRKGDTAESLNVAVATAITCSEFRRRR